mgnify:CR=1 FL=1
MACKLGFGLMRLPRLEDGSIDIEQGKEMADYFLANGGTYFDTAFVYEGSEEATRKILVERYPRDSYTLASKINARVAKSAEDARAQLATSLERTGAGYFDYYLLHAMNAENRITYRDYGLWEFVAEQKEKGLIRHMGFSFHDKPEVLEEILTKHPEAEFVQLQINYADMDNPDVQSEANLAVARKFGKPVVVMEPVKGGLLAAPIQEVRDIFTAVSPDASPASWAIRFVASQEGILTVLSGMSDLAQVEDNVSFMKKFKPLNKEELAAIAKAQEILKTQKTVPCTACRYCVEGCPMGIPIPDIFKSLNRLIVFNDEKGARWRYGRAVEGKGKASDCIGCGACESTCPQQLSIRDLLADAAKQLEE